MKLGDICSFDYGKPLKEENRIEGEYPVFGSNGIVGYHNEYIVEAPFLVIGRKGTAGAVHYSDKNGFPIDTTFFVKLSNEDKIDTKYLYRILKNAELAKLSEQAGVPGLNRNDAYEFQIPLPPLEVQRNIVAEIESYQKIIDGARQVVENYKPRISVNPKWEVVELGSVLKFIGSGATPLGGKAVYKNKGVMFIRSQNVLWGISDYSDAVFIEGKTHDEMKRSQVKKNDVLLNITGASIGRCSIFEENYEANVNQHVTILRTKEEILPKYLMNVILSANVQSQIWTIQSGGTRQALNYEQIKELHISLPSLSEQTAIIQRIEEEKILVNTNKKLVEIFEGKIKAKISEVWGE